MSTDIVTTAVRENARALQQSPVLLEASEALATIPDTLVIRTDEEDAAWGDVAKKCARGAKHIEGGMTDLFRPMKTFEKMLREHFKTTIVDPLNRGVSKIDTASLAHRLEKARKAEEARVAAERAAAEAAELARQQEEARRKEAEALAAEGLELAPASEEESLDAPGVAEVIVPPVEKIVRSEETTTSERRTLECVMESESEARKYWPDAFLFDGATCLAQFKAGEERGERELDAGIVVGGVRFKNKITIIRRDR